MNLIWHIVKKDARHLRWFVLGTWLLQVLMLGFNGYNRSFSGIWLALLFVANLVLAAVGTALLVHEDPPVGAGARWITMPISGGRLLAAKVAGATLLFWIPPCLLQIYSGVFRVDPFGPLASGFANLISVGLVVATAFLVATLTDNSVRFFMWMLIAVGAEPFVFGDRLFRLAFVVVSPRWALPASNASDPSWIRVLGWFTLLGCLALIAIVVVHQFRTRRTLRSIVLTMIGIAVIGVGGNLARKIARDYRVEVRRTPGE